MSSIRRKYTTRSGEVKTYTYTRDVDTNADIKRKKLLGFIEEYKVELDQIDKKKDKIKFIQDNIGDEFTYSSSMLYRYI